MRLILPLPPNNPDRSHPKSAPQLQPLRAKTVANTPPLAAIATEVSVVSSIANSFLHYDLPNLQWHSSLYQVGTMQLMENFKVLCHDFITFNNIPMKVATNHLDCPEFKKMLMFAMKHGQQMLHSKHDNIIKCQIKCQIIWHLILTWTCLYNDLHFILVRTKEWILFWSNLVLEHSILNQFHTKSLQQLVFSQWFANLFVSKWY